MRLFRGGTIQASAAMYLTSSWDYYYSVPEYGVPFISAGVPNYSMTLAWTGHLPVNTLVGVCLDNWTNTQYLTLQLRCYAPSNCNFSGFLIA